MNFVGVLFYLLLSSQVVFIGPEPPDYCSSEEIQPNLVIRQDTELTGTITDKLGAPLTYSRVELRSYETQARQKTVRIVHTDGKGQFNLDKVEKGYYRLLASPTRAFKQPSGLECAAQRCRLKVTLQIINPDTGRYEGCPIAQLRRNGKPLQTAGL
jgi:hypothetical protein